MCSRIRDLLHDVRRGWRSPFADGTKEEEISDEDVEEPGSSDQCQRSDKKQIVICMDALDVKYTDVRSGGSRNNGDTEKSPSHCLFVQLDHEPCSDMNQGNPT